MIVPSMTAPEMVKEILDDIPAVHKKSGYLLETLRRPAIKSKHRYAEKMFEYKSPQHNRWNIYAEHYIRYGLRTHLVRYNDHLGLNGVVTYDNGALGHYSSHFFKRYHERNLNNQPMDINCMLAQFMKHQLQDKMDIYATDSNNRSYFFARSLEGVKLGYCEFVSRTPVMYFKTFITLDMLRNEQITTSQKLAEALLNDLKSHCGFKLKKMGIAA